MGCDIHGFVEYRQKGFADRWSPFGGHINPGRDYRVFGRMAGVRGGEAIVEPRGIPDDLGYMADKSEKGWWLYISSAPGDVSPEKAQEWHKVCGKRLRPESGMPRWIEHPDWHTPSWLTPDEFASAIAVDGVDPQYGALLAAMRHLEKSGFEVRFVFWFDN